MYKCKFCFYITDRLRNLRRHENRKYSCHKKTSENVKDLEETYLPNLGGDSNNVNSDCSHDDESSNYSETTVGIDHVCSKCKIGFTYKHSMLRHEKKCTGLHPLQCRICLRFFASKQSKRKHTHYVKCSQPLQKESCLSNQTINNNNNITNNNNVYNINIVRGDFYQISNDDIQKIVEQLENNEYLKMIQDNMDTGKYVIPRTMEQIYFNDKHPNLQTLKKERRNDKMVEVHVGKGKWEKRLIEDIFRMVVRNIEKYHTQYFKHFEKKYENQDLVIGSAKWKQLTRTIKTFGNTMLWYEGFRGNDILNMGIELNCPNDDDDNEKERERRNREMEHILGETVYDQTRNVGKNIKL